jgi:cytochrome bd ubiquinol oxidase subunit I
MDLTALLLSRANLLVYIYFRSFTIGLAVWLTVLKALKLATSRPRAA